jgi:hypothetical protein
MGDMDPVTKQQFIEVTNRQAPTASGGEDPWVPIDGSEQIILGDLSILADGAPVEVSTGEKETKVASADGHPTTTHTSTSQAPANSPPTAVPVETSNGSEHKTADKF